MQILYWIAFFSASAAVNINPKEKRKKKKALSEGLYKFQQAFRLKNFPFKRVKSKNERNLLGKILSETRRA
jgi:hypothetical protein